MSTIKEYLSELSGRRVTVIGMGVSNIPLIKMLLRAGVEVTVRDRSPRERLAEQAQELESLGARLILGENYLKDLPEELIFRTPGLSPNTPELLDAVQRGAALSSEMEVFFQTCPGRLIGVTGSDGKTTTTTIIAEFLKEAGKNVYVGGNIGRPLLADVADMVEEDYAVLELSSFQLMTMDQSPHIAVVTNISPNHLDYHHTMEEYVQAKKNIFLHQSPEDRLILNFDNPGARSMASEAVCPVTWFSRKWQLDEGVYLRDEAIWLTNEQGSREVLPLELIQLPGDHNIENYMAAIAAVADRVRPGAGRGALVQRLHRHQPHPHHRLPGVLPPEGHSDCRRIRQGSPLYPAWPGDRGPGEDPGPHRGHRPRHPPGGGAGGRVWAPHPRYFHGRGSGRGGKRGQGRRPAGGHRGPLAGLRRLRPVQEFHGAGAGV